MRALQPIRDHAITARVQHAAVQLGARTKTWTIALFLACITAVQMCTVLTVAFAKHAALRASASSRTGIVAPRKGESEGPGRVWQNLSLFNLQSAPRAVVLIALGLGGTEDSAYFQDLVNGLPASCLIVGVRGYETSLNTRNEKFFVKNDSSRITQVMEWLCATYPSAAKIGIGVSLGGALILRHQASEHPELIRLRFDEVITVSTSLWYEHAVKSMNETPWGYMAHNQLMLWQFERLFFGGPNYLTVTCKLAYSQWARMLFSRSMLDQDRMLCEFYNMDYESYILDLDIRLQAKRVRNLHYLISSLDPMFSPSHLAATKEFLGSASNISHKIVDFGGHGWFTSARRAERNDYLLEYCSSIIDKYI